MARGRTRNADKTDRILDRALKHGFVQVMTAAPSATWTRPARGSVVALVVGSPKNSKTDKSETSRHGLSRSDPRVDAVSNEPASCTQKCDAARAGTRDVHVNCSRTLRIIRSSPKRFNQEQGVDMGAHEIVAIATRFVVDTRQADSPWIDINEAARRARCGVKLLYREVRAGRLQAARVGGRRELRLQPEWVDDWLRAATTIR